jgi:hypothetical protein
MLMLCQHFLVVTIGFSSNCRKNRSHPLRGTHLAPICIAGHFRYVQRSIRRSGGRVLIPSSFNPRETARYYHRLLAAA